MKAARLHRLGEPIRVDEIPAPEIGPREVLVRVLRAGLNRGDLHMRSGHIRVRPGEEKKHLPALPLTIGHDGLGEIVAVAPDVRGVSPGDRVVVNCQLTCGFCRFCREGRQHLCVHHRTMGFVSFFSAEDIFLRYKDGLCAEYCRVPASNVIALRPGDSIDQIALISQMAVGFRALKRTRLEPGETVIVNGATGITGTGVILCALAMGAARVIAIARDQARLARLKSVDPRRVTTVSVEADSIRDRVAEITRGNGANVLVDLNPQGPQTMIECLYALEQGGRAALIAGHSDKVELPYTVFMIRSIEFMSWHGRAREDIAQLIELCRRGVIDVSQVRPRFFALEEINDALSWIEKKDPGEMPVWPMMRAN